MNIRNALITSTLLAAGLVSGAAHAALQGRDLDGNTSTLEAYYDTVLDITWLADANYAQTSGYDADGQMTWAVANTWAANLSFTDGTHTYNNWRLPSVQPVNQVSYQFNLSYDGSTDVGYNITSHQSEMAHMFYVTLGNLGSYTPSGMPGNCYACLEHVGPFSNLQPLVYWSATGHSGDPTIAWDFDMSLGYQSGSSKTYESYAWAVSSGDVGAAVPEAQTYALMLAGLGLVGWRARRRG